MNYILIYSKTNDKTKAKLLLLNTILFTSFSFHLQWPLLRMVPVENSTNILYICTCDSKVFFPTKGMMAFYHVIHNKCII